MKYFVTNTWLTSSNAGKKSMKENTVAYSELCQTSKMEKFAKIVNDV